MTDRLSCPMAFVRGYYLYQVLKSNEFENKNACNPGEMG